MTPAAVLDTSDCFVDDAPSCCAHRARCHRGAPRRAVAQRHLAGDNENVVTQERETIRARTLVNAGGPWVENVLNVSYGVNAKAKVRLVQGSHIIVPKLYAHDRAYIFQMPTPRRLCNSVSE